MAALSVKLFRGKVHESSLVQCHLNEQTSLNQSTDKVHLVHECTNVSMDEGQFQSYAKTIKWYRLD